MKRITFLRVAVGTLAGVVGFTTRASRQSDEAAAPLFVTKIPLGYRRRIGSAEGEPRYDGFERRLAESPVIAAPAITLAGDARRLLGKYSHRLIKGGVGYNLPVEAPQGFAQAVIDVDSY